MPQKYSLHLQAFSICHGRPDTLSSYQYMTLCVSWALGLIIAGSIWVYHIMTWLQIPFLSLSRSLPSELYWMGLGQGWDAQSILLPLPLYRSHSEPTAPWDHCSTRKDPDPEQSTCCCGKLVIEILAISHRQYWPGYKFSQLGHVSSWDQERSKGSIHGHFLGNTGCWQLPRVRF